ncbi:MAG: HAMP domain-containing protein [Desulfobacterales bacterium]|nr:HAMP domain-containing protein [Desulfobacterales bacterium]
MKLHFGHKLAIIMTVLVLAASCIVGYTMVFRQFMLLEKQFSETGTMLADQLSAGSVELVFTEDHLSLLSLVNSLSEQSPVVSAAFINRDGKVLAEAGRPIPVDRFAERIAAQNAGSLSNQSSTVWFYSPVVFQDVTAGTAWVGLDKSDYIAAQGGLIRSGIIVVVLLVMAVSLVAIRLGRSLGRPVRDLIQGTRAIEAGDYGFRIQGNYGGEFKALTRAFNSMAEGLEQKIRVERLFSQFVSNPVAARYIARDHIEISREGRRVEASVLFVDLSGYTAFSEDRRPEETAEVLNFYFTEFAEICHQCTGNVDKYIGDCTMMIFGCPQQDPQHPFQAMQCAIRLRERMAELNSKRARAGQPCLNVRIGLTGGTVLAGLFGCNERLQYTVVGEPANLASRLCDLASPGQIMTDKAFYREVNSVYPLQAHENRSISVKGFKTNVEVMVIDNWISATYGITPSFHKLQGNSRG